LFKVYSIKLRHGTEVFNRRETKFLVNKDVYESIQKELLKYMELDGYNKKHEFYTISNIYFDTQDNYLIRNSLAKPKYKEKLRLRSYGVPGENEKVYLEIKKKVCGLVNKRRTTLRLNEAYDFVSTGVKPEIKEYMNKQVINEIEYILKIYDLAPRLYLAYDRKAMFGKENRDLRITFDTNIRTRREDLRLELGDHGESLLDGDKWLMEVKAEKSIPIWLSKLLSKHKIISTSFSKYGEEYRRMLINNRVMKGEMNLCLNQYIKTCNKNGYSQNFSLTLILVPTVIAIIILLIGSNVARAFSLAGAFSIIKFRSAPGDPKDIAYVLFTMAAGLACGVGYFGYAALFTVFLCSLMFILNAFNFGSQKNSYKILKITIPEDLDYEGAFDEVFNKFTTSYDLKKVKTTDLGSLYELVYTIAMDNKVNQKEFIDALRCRNGNLNITLSMQADASEY
jgi:hypothetical protein